METNNPSIEKMVIANLWTNYDKLDISIVNPNWFTDNRMRSIWIDSLKWISEKGDKDPVSFDHLHKYNVTQIITDCHNFPVTEHHFEEHVRLLRAESDKHSVWSLLSLVNNDFLVDTETAIKMVKEWVVNYDSKQILNVSLKDPKEEAFEYIEHLEHKKSLGNAPEFSCGDNFKYLDLKIWGFGRGELVIIGGATGKGKSTLALNFCHSLIENQKKVLYFSTEMSRNEKRDRFMSLSCQIPAWKFRRADFDMNEISIINKKNEEISTNGFLTIEDQPSPTLLDIETVAKRVKPQVIVIDHLQRCSFGKEDRNDLAVGKFVKGLKSLARTLDCPIIVLSQLNRGDGINPNRKPQLRDLKESSGIEQEADIVMFLSSNLDQIPTDDNEGLILDVAKNRHGSIGFVKINFQKNFLKMYEVME